jgi:protein required for attachment to host cells
VLQVADPEQPLLEVEDLVNPQARMHERDLQSDQEPRFNGHGGVGKAGTAPTGGPASDREAQGAIEHGVTVFAKQIGRYLEQARHQHRYDELVLIAPPKFLGALRRELDKEVEKLVADELPKDLSGFNNRELARYLAER